MHLSGPFRLFGSFPSRHAAAWLTLGAGDPVLAGKRRIKNTCLDYLSSLKDPKITKMALDQAMNAGGMTDRVAATAQLAASDDAAARDKALGDFYENHAKGNDLILCKFFTMQAIADTDNALEKVNGLLKHPDFSLKNPNKCRSLVGAFAGNMRHFHAKDGSGYRCAPLTPITRKGPVLSIPSWE